MNNKSLLRTKYLINRATVFIPLLIAMLADNVTAAILSSAAAGLYLIINYLLRKCREVARCLYDHKHLTLIYSNGSSQRLVIEDIECYCKLPLRTGIHIQPSSRLELASLPASIVMKLINTDILIQMRTVNIDPHLLHLIETQVEEVPRKVLCPPASAWLIALQSAYVALMVISVIYIANLLQ